MPVSRRGFLRLVGTADRSPLRGLPVRTRARGASRRGADTGAARPSCAAAGRRRDPHQQQRESARARQGRARRDSRQVPRGGPLSVQQHAGRQRELVETIAAKYKAKPENVVLGAGSQEILKSAMRAFTSPYARAGHGARRRSRTAPATRSKLRTLPLTEVKVDSAVAARPRGDDRGGVDAAPAWSSSTTRTTRRRPCTARRP